MIEILNSLIAIPSVSGTEQAIFAFIRNVLQENTKSTLYENDLYVAAKIPGQNRDRALLLAGHTDTVSAEQAELWDHNPWQPTLVKNRLYGLGAADMKAGLAIMLKLYEYYRHKKPPVDIWFVFAANEELDGSGTAAFVKECKPLLQNYSNRFACILEPTPANTFCFGSKGNAFVELLVKGNSGHGSLPPVLPAQTIHKCSLVLNELRMLEATWQARYTDTLLGPPTITATGLGAHSGSPNKLPSTGKITIDIRTTPMLDKVLEKELGVWSKMRNIHFDAIAAPCQSTITSLKTSVAAFLTTGLGLHAQPYPGATDQVFFVDAGIPTYILGPGELHNAHQPNEYVSTKELDTYLGYYRKIIGYYASA